MKIGKALKLILKEKGLSQKELSELSGISETSISQIIKDNSQPKKETIETISKVLEIQPEVILLLSLERDNLSKEKQQLYDNLWPFVQNAVISIFSEKLENKPLT